MNTKPIHIIVIRLSAMGDVAMTVPAIRSLSAAYPDLKITMVSRAFFKPFFDNIPNVTFFVFDGKKKHGGIFGDLKLFWELRALKPTYYVDFHNVLRTKFIGFLFRFTAVRTTIIDKKRSEKKAITAKVKVNFSPIETVFEKQVNALSNIGFKVNLSRSVFPEKLALSNKITDTIAIDFAKKLIGIAPFAQYQTKVYPLDLMQIVVDDMANHVDRNVLLCGGGKDEILLLEKLANKHKNVFVIAGKISFQEELNIISHLDVMLSMDSGNAHIAAMLGVKVVTLWGATHPFTGFTPFNQSMENCLTSDRLLYPEIPTSVYGDKIVNGYENAMRTILPSSVITKLNSILEDSNKY